jgi:hypothetical protein
MLAIEPDLAAVPWNVLMPAVGGEKVPLVSLIPSLSWLRDHKRRELSQRRESSPSRCVTPTVDVLARDHPEDTPEFARLVRAAKALADAPIRASRSVFVGHGLWNPAIQMTTVDGPGGPIPLETWLNSFGVSLGLINSCQGGKTEGHAIADLAGLPGLALVAGCQCLLAPITRLRPDDLAHLCDVLAIPDAGATVVERLNAAFARHPAIRQVAVFGDPTVSLASY